MKTPLFFKLLLLLALGFRLLKAAKKSVPKIQPTLSMAPGPLQGWGIAPPPDLTDKDQIKWLYRQHVRSIPWEKMTAAQQGIWLLNMWMTQRESAFRWLWYRSECALAWRELLERMGWSEAAAQWALVLQEVSGQEAPRDPASWIPLGDRTYPALETFQQIICSESIYSKLLTYVVTVSIVPESP